MTDSQTPPNVPNLAGQPFRRILAGEKDLPRDVATEFEKPRGLIDTQVRPGFTLIVVQGLAEPILQKSIEILEALANTGVSIDFLKLSFDGLSFVVPDAKKAVAVQAVEAVGIAPMVVEGRCVLSVTSANLRDEEGMAARIVSAVIASGTRLDHMSDMHDRVLFLISRSDADKATQAVQALASGVSA